MDMQTGAGVITPPANIAVPTTSNLEASVAQTVLKLEEILAKFEHLLRGHEYKGYGRWEVATADKDGKIYSNAYMNERGIQYTMLNLTMMMSRITALQHKPIEQAYDELYTFMAHYEIWLRCNSSSRLKLRTSVNFEPQYFHSFIAMLTTTLSSIITHDAGELILGINPEGLRTQQPAPPSAGALLRV